jgi:hypothetical protein
MKWPVLVGKARIQPAAGSWNDWKQAIADYCEGRCVYCAIPESRFGGIRNFHIAHFRPKAKFRSLENDIGNLYLSCSICNVLKCDDWPAEPAADHSRVAYPDPSRTDFNALLVVSAATREVDSQAVAGKYLIERVLLNRAQLIVERRLTAALRSFEEFRDWVDVSAGKMTHKELVEVVRLLCTIDNIKTGALGARPYKDGDAKRRVNAKVAKKRSKW